MKNNANTTMVTQMPEVTQMPTERAPSVLFIGIIMFAAVGLQAGKCEGRLESSKAISHAPSSLEHKA